MSFEVTTFAAIKYISYTINGILAIFWGKKKVVLNHFLCGRWKGHLVDKNDSNFSIDCTLYLDYQKDACEGSLIYKTTYGERQYRGVDQLIQYTDHEFLPKVWNPVFQRLFHENIKDEIIYTDKRNYTFNCKIQNRWFKNRMHVILCDNRVLEGIWHRK